MGCRHSGYSACGLPHSELYHCGDSLKIGCRSLLPPPEGRIVETEQMCRRPVFRVRIASPNGVIREPGSVQLTKHEVESEVGLMVQQSIKNASQRLHCGSFISQLILPLAIRPFPPILARCVRWKWFLQP